MMNKNTRPAGVAETMPSLPAKSVDFDALQSALRAGKSGEEAVEAAITPKPTAPAAPALADEPDQPVDPDQ